MQIEVNISNRWRARATWVACAVLASASVALGPGPTKLPRGPGDVAGWLARTPVDETIAAAAFLAGCAFVAWAVLVTGLALAGRLPGLLGRSATRLAVTLTPRALRTLLHVSVGVSVGVAATVGGATAAEATTARRPPAPATTVPSLDWPVAPAEARSPAPPATHSAATPHRAESRPRTPTRIVVRPGDTLWGIAGRALGGRPTPARVARAWPRWYAANRAVIGADPDVIYPGQRLRPPDPQGETP